MRMTPLALLALLACTDKDSLPVDSNVAGDDSATPADEDGDGYAGDDDCDDNDPAVNPGSVEVCDGVDNNCDGVADEGVTVTVYSDADGDGYGDETTASEACEAGEGQSAQGGDCDDADPSYNPAALEDDCADPNDYNCDGSVGYADEDGDGWAACEECDDANAAVNPDAAEVCNEVDDDCDSSADEGVTATFWADADGDGFGDRDVEVEACEAPSGYADNREDCDDDEAAVNPDAAEVCNGRDDDCDYDIDDADSDVDLSTGTAWYADSDADGFGDDARALLACDAPRGYSAVGGDCDDGEAAAYPGHAEACDAIDNDCDSGVDEGATTTYYLDGDGDGYGLTATSVEGCSAPRGYSAVSGDCDDGDVAYNPGASLGCDGEDYDCDGAVDSDADGDGYADEACGGDDCDDSDASVIPETSGACALGTDCLSLYASGYTADGTYSIDPDGYGVGEDPFDVSCDMTTDGGGWTLMLHFFDMGGSAGLSEDDFIALYGHNLFTDETWSYDAGSAALADGLSSGGLVSLSSQGAISTATMDGLWDDLRMACSLSDSDATESYYAQVDGYASTNGSWGLLGAAANGTSYTVNASLNSSGLSTIWHDNETTTQNSGHYLCDVTNSAYTSSVGGAPQLSFCYTDFLSNPNTLDYGDSIVAFAFGTYEGSDSWSAGFTMECGAMGTTALQNEGTISVWVR